LVFSIIPFGFSLLSLIFQLLKKMIDGFLGLFFTLLGWIVSVMGRLFLFVKKKNWLFFLLSIPCMQSFALISSLIFYVTPWFFIIGFLVLAFHFINIEPVKMKS
jgi:hypothetical protein